MTIATKPLEVQTGYPHVLVVEDPPTLKLRCPSMEEVTLRARCSTNTLTIADWFATSDKRIDREVSFTFREDKTWKSEPITVVFRTRSGLDVSVVLEVIHVC